MDTARLTGQRVLIVGGARDLGLAIARRVSDAGATALVGARSIEHAREAAATIPGAEAVQVDVTDETSITRALAQVGDIDHIVVLASAHHNVPVTEFTAEGLAGAVAAKVTGPLLLAKHAATVLPPTGSLVLISGVAAWTPTPGYAVMGITNGAVSFAASHLAREMAPIRVNAVSPGIIDSGSWDQMDDKQGFLAGAAAGTLVGRHGESDDITEAVVWLLGAGFVTGETVHVDGGARFA
ncbi:SDR family oxidoreductase [Dietzia sp.]|uniref:SDR family oxidoreductase n=1 Tax=Dietzia sp. TaxID=1871616 RepID=UPI002FD9CFE4